MVEGGLGEYSSTTGNWRIAEGIVAWFEEADQPDFIRTYAWGRKMEDYGKFEPLWEKYKKERIA